MLAPYVYDDNAYDNEGYADELAYV